MIVYRIANKKYIDSTLNGVGAEKVGGRWNLPGPRAVYCSENISLALLEYYIHSQNMAILPPSILVAKIKIPDYFNIESLEELPVNWQQYPYTKDSAKIFTEFVKDKNAFALKVPSAIVKLEHNFILNPLYKEFEKVEILEFIDLFLDNRLINN